MTQYVTELIEFPEINWLRCLPLRTPTLPPATHTNCYLVGNEGLLIVDPASPHPEEQARLDDCLDALGLSLQAIFLTHHHRDHVGGAAHLAQRRKLAVWAHAETAARVSIPIARRLSEGERLPFAPGGIDVLHTPGHAPGHLCLYQKESGAAIVGDMVASVGTIIIEPSDGGDMTVYLESLRRLRALPLRWLLPAHGPRIERPDDKLDFYLQHRQQREDRVVAALSSELQTLEQLVAPAYPDVPVALHGLAASSLLAHLIKLEREGRARRSGDFWART